MQLATREYKETTVGVQNEIAVTFQANAVAFYAQFSGLAKDKVGYSMRELPTNMWDATRRKYGHTVPLDRMPEVHLPTNLNPVIRFRDYGPGMSPVEMETVYAQVYASTKRENNDEVGGWGLGRFSPLAYLIGQNGAGSYSVTSITDGVSRTYVVSINQGGAPVLRLLAEVETEQPSGMEVSFPVRREDVYRFQEKAREILWSFAPRPRITPAPEWSEPEITARGERWTLYKDRTVPFRTPHVRMGCVMYPIDLDAMDQGYGFTEDDDAILFEAPIGSLSVTLSREALAYDERTIATLKNLLNEFCSDRVMQVDRQVRQATTYFEACKIFEDAVEHEPTRRKSYLRANVAWRDAMPIRHAISSNSTVKYCVLDKEWDEFERFSKDVFYPHYMADTTVVIEHQPFRSLERFRKAGLVGQKVLWVRAKRVDLAAALTALGGPEHIILDDFKVEAGPRNTTKIRKRRAIRVNEGGGAMDDIVEIDMAAGGRFIRLPVPPVHYYGRRRRRSTSLQVSGVGEVESYNLRRFLRSVHDLGLVEDGTTFLVVKHDEKILPGWEEFDAEDLIEQVKAKVNPEDFSGLAGKGTSQIDSDFREFGSAPIRFDHAPEDMKAFKADVKALYDLLNSDRAQTESHRAVEALRIIGRPYQVPADSATEPCNELETRFIELKDKYPFFASLVRKSLSSYNRDEAQRGFDHYFELLRAAYPHEFVAPEPTQED